MNYTYKHIWLINFPVMMSILIEQLINITDAIFLGHVGEIELGASALAGIWYLAIYMLGFGFSMGLQVVIARRNGEQHYSETGKTFFQGLFFLSGLAVFLCLFSKLFSPMILRTGKSLSDYVEAAKQYSPLLHDYRHQLQIEQAELRRLKALYTRSRLELNGDYLFVPVLTKDGGQTSFRWNAQDATDYYGYDLGESSGHLHTGATWTQPLLGHSSYKVAQEQSRINMDMARNHIRLEENQLERAVTEQYRLDSLNTAASLRSFNLQYKPRLDLFVDGGMQTGSFSQWYRHFGWSAGLTFTWTLFDGRQKRWKERQAELQQQSIRIYRDHAEYQRSMRLRQCLSELEKYDRREKALTEQLAGYERVLSDYAREVEAGQVSVLDYLTVLRNKIQTERDALLMRTNRQLVIAAYNYWNH